MKHVLIIILLLSSLHNLKGQNSRDKLLYYDKNWEECSKDSASYFRIIEKYYSKRKVYSVTDYYITGEKQMKGKYVDPDTEIMQGAFTWYYRNGNTEYKVNYDRSTPIGKYYKWYEDGSPKVVGKYLRDRGDKSISSQKIISFWDSTGTQLVVKGSGAYYETGQKHTAQGSLLKGFKHGKWKGTDPATYLKYEEEFIKGRMIEGNSTDSTGATYPYRQIHISPSPSLGMEAFFAYIRNNLKYPTAARRHNVEGVVYLEFWVEETGLIANAKIYRKLGYGCDEEALRVLSNAPKWNPGQRRGVPSRMKMILPIRFQLI